MNLEALMLKVNEFANDANVELELGESKNCYEVLGNLYDLLDDEVGSKARDKCESAESSNGS